MGKYRLAELRCYEKNSIGIDVSDTLSYVFVEEARYIGTKDYQNVFKYESFPVIRKTVYGEYINYYFEDNAKDVFDEYGEVGLCYLLTDVSIDNLSIEDLKNIVIYSDSYFKDRKDLIEERMENHYTNPLFSTVYSDINDYEKFKSFLEKKGLDERGKKLVR